MHRARAQVGFAVSAPALATRHGSCAKLLGRRIGAGSTVFGCASRHRSGWRGSTSWHYTISWGAVGFGYAEISTATIIHRPNN